MWITYTLLGALLWAMACIVEKYVLTKLVKNLYVPIVILGTISFIVGISIFYFKGISLLPNFELFLALAGGAFSTFTAIAYFKALQTDQEVSRLIPIFYTTPIFVGIFAFLFLGEVFNGFSKYIGILLFVIGAILINYKNGHGFKFNKGILYIFLSVLYYAITQVITKYLLDVSDYWSVFAHIRITSFIFIIPFIVTHFNDFKQLLFQKSKKPLILISLTEGWNLLGYFFITLASSIGSITLVNAMVSVQPVFVLMIAIFLSHFYPKIIKEELGKGVISLKFLSITLIIAGAILVS